MCFSLSNVHGHTPWYLRARLYPLYVPDAGIMIIPVAPGMYRRVQKLVSKGGNVRDMFVFVVCSMLCFRKCIRSLGRARNSCEYKMTSENDRTSSTARGRRRLRQLCASMCALPYSYTIPLYHTAIPYRYTIPCRQSNSSRYF